MDNQVSLSQMIGNKIMLQDIVKRVPKQINIVEKISEKIANSVVSESASKVGGAVENITSNAIVKAQSDTYITIKDKLLGNKLMLLVSILMMVFTYVFWKWYNDENIFPQSIEHKEKEEQ